MKREARPRSSLHAHQHGTTWYWPTRLLESRISPLPLAEKTLEAMKARFGLNDLATIQSMGNLAIAYESAGKYDLALPLSEAAVKAKIAGARTRSIPIRRL